MHISTRWRPSSCAAKVVALRFFGGLTEADAAEGVRQDLAYRATRVTRGSGSARYFLIEIRTPEGEGNPSAIASTSRSPSGSEAGSVIAT